MSKIRKPRKNSRTSPELTTFNVIFTKISNEKSSYFGSEYLRRNYGVNEEAESITCEDMRTDEGAAIYLEIVYNYYFNFCCQKMETIFGLKRSFKHIAHVFEFPRKKTGDSNSLNKVTWKRVFQSRDTYRRKMHLRVGMHHVNL